MDDKRRTITTGFDSGESGDKNPLEGMHPADLHAMTLDPHQFELVRDYYTPEMYDEIQQYLRGLDEHG